MPLISVNSGRIHLIRLDKSLKKRSNLLFCSVVSQDLDHERFGPSIIGANNPALGEVDVFYAAEMRDQAFIHFNGWSVHSLLSYCPNLRLFKPSVDGRVNHNSAKAVYARDGLFVKLEGI